jgi:exosortase/archaeosortase
MSQNGGKPWLNPSRRWVIYTVAGSGISLPHYVNTSSGYDKVVLVLLAVSICCYLKYDLANHNNLNFVTGTAVGVWIVALFAWLYGRLTQGTITFLLTASVTALIWAAHTDYKGAKGR